MTEQEALFAAILANPANDTPRLMFADWLDEHAGESECVKCGGRGWYDRNPGDGEMDCPACSGTGRISNGFAERAEFIRVQVELAQADPREVGALSQSFGTAHFSANPPRFTDDENYDAWKFAGRKITGEQWKRLCRIHELRRREGELLDLLGHELIGMEWPSVVNKSPYIVVPVGWENIGHMFRRGFLAELECPWSWWLQHADAIRAAQPVERVRLTTQPSVMERRLTGTGPILLTKELVMDMFPGIAFELPPVERSVVVDTTFNFVVQDRRRHVVFTTTSANT